MGSLTAKELQKIRGIGAAISARLLAAGHDTFRKVADLGEEGLRKFKGINFKAIPDIIRQAETLAVEALTDKEKRVKAAADSLDMLKRSAGELISSASSRFGETLTKKRKKRLTEAMIRFVDALAKLEEKIGKKPKRAGRVIGKTETGLAALAEADGKALQKGLNKARKSIRKVIK